ncbi:hypothetical protein [Photobacterium damselae]|uniref:hypothetical protein n=1 Tax=Photobacterium damselae TaxID=38293 RepID=UPI00165D7005|nr:hypothetical protein [Photobacterium damselae]
MRLALLITISGCLVGCSAPQPPAISGKPQPVNINQPKTISPKSTDYADNNWSKEGRTNNRRVDVNIYTDCSEE